MSDELKRLVELAERQEQRGIASTSDLKHLIELAERQEKRDLDQYPYRFNVWQTIPVLIALIFAIKVFMR